MTPWKMNCSSVRRQPVACSIFIRAYRPAQQFLVGFSLRRKFEPRWPFPSTGELLKYCTWLVLLDRLLDAQPLKGGHMISYEQGARRDVIVLTESLSKFEREFGYQLRQSNFDPTPEAVRELIQSSSELIDEGLLGLIRSGERSQDVL